MLVAMASAPFSQLLLTSPPGSQHASGGGAAANSVSRRPDWLLWESQTGTLRLRTYQRARPRSPPLFLSVWGRAADVCAAHDCVRHVSD